MSRKTTYYELVQPDYNDTADIEVLNSNMDIIDEALNSLKNQGGGGSGADLTELTNKVNANTEAIENLDTTKADKSTTLSGYGITDGVTKTELDDAIAGVSGGGGGGTVDAYTKTQTDALLSNKVDKEDGKGLFSGSYNDLTDAPTIPTKTSELQNDSGYLTEHQDLSSYAKKTDIPSLNGYATEQWVGEQGYLTEHQDISGYATKASLQAVSDSLLNNTKAVDYSLKTLIRHTVSDEWNDTTTYEVGQYCIFSNRLWKCLIRNSGRTPQEGTYWTQTSIDKEITELSSNLANTKRTLLWTNQSPSNAFASQDITLSDDISNYECYEIIYKEQNSASNQEISTGRINVGNTTVFQSYYGWLYRRSVSSMSNNTMTIGDCVYYKSYGNTTTEAYNFYLVPLKVYGYKNA